MIRPSYGLAEQRCTSRPAAPDNRRSSRSSSRSSRPGAERCRGTALISYGTPDSPLVRIVEPELRTECPAGTIGRSGCTVSVSAGYWNKRGDREHVRRRIRNAPADLPGERWLRTGDLGFISEDELFIIGRMKDLLIIADAITIPTTSRRRCRRSPVAGWQPLAVPDDATEALVVIAEG